MPALMDSRDRVGRLVDAAIHLIDVEGVRALTVRRLAAVLRVSPSTLTSHLTNQHRILDLVAKSAGRRLIETVGSACRRDGIDGLVLEDEVVPLARAWAALVVLADGDDQHRLGVAQIEKELHAEVAWIARVPARDVLTREALALAVTGLWAARCRRPDPLPFDQAAAVLRHLCAALGIESGSDAPEPD